MKRLKEIKENHFLLVRSKKRLPKIKNFKLSEKMLELRKNQENYKEQAGELRDLNGLINAINSPLVGGDKLN